MLRYGALTFGETHNDLKKYAPKNWSDSSLPEWGVYNPNTAKAWHSYRGTHALPTYLSAVNNLVLRAALPAGLVLNFDVGIISCDVILIFY